MICKFCGNEIDDNAFFFVLCGEIVDNSDDGKKQKVDLKKRATRIFFLCMTIWAAIRTKP